MTRSCRKAAPPKSFRALLAVALLAALPACEGDTGPPGPPGAGVDPPLTDRDVPAGEASPGIVAEITAVTGGTGPGGNLMPGNRPTVQFTLKKDDDTPWTIEEMDRARIMISGPTFNYQRVVAEISDVADRAVMTGEGEYSYTFEDPLPATYLAPYNDGPDYDADYGELTGQALLDGTYTVWMGFRWNYTVEGSNEREIDNAAFDFLLGSSNTLMPREVVANDNCNQCHSQLSEHGRFRQGVTSCLMCHTAGMESSNPPNSVLGKTEPLDFQAMIHRLHSGQSLPSVQGVTTDMTGARDYTVPPASYEYENVVFPVWPNLAQPMPKDTGYAALGGADQDKEDAMRSGVTSCFVCHGDPDGDGPIGAPAQGDLVYTTPSRRACTSCHDDWIPELPYTANTQTMPPQTGDATCTLCHTETGSHLSVRDGHVHPLLDTLIVDGMELEITALDEQTGDMDGTLDPGEIPEVTFTLQDAMGTDVDPADLAALNFGLHGPTANSQYLLHGSIPTERLTGAQPYTSTLPMRVYYEYLGDAGAAPGSFPTSLTPHWDLASAPTEVYVRTASGASSTLTAPAEAPVNYVDVASGASFARDDYVVIDDGMASVEYLQIQWVDGDRLWFSSPYTPAYAPGPVNDHAMGATVQVVTLTAQTEGVDYTLDAMTGTVNESVGFGNGNAVVASYVTDYRMPSTYPLALNAGADLGEADGGWAGKALVDGTYTVALWAEQDYTVPLWGESNDYTEVSPDASLDFLVGGATTPEPYALIESAAGCYRCHQDIQFHGDHRRGVASCLACHGTAASGDRTRYVAANAPETEGVTVNFREMVHKIHHGEALEQDYEVIGFGFGYPNNFSSHTYDEVVFPAMPDETMDCAVCHGESNEAWIEPSDRIHPVEVSGPVSNWTIACASCHDSSGAQAHMEAQTAPSGGESCSICHSPGKSAPVEASHMVR